MKNRLKKGLKYALKYIESRKTNNQVAEFIRKNNLNNVEFVPNYWSKNQYWDIYCQRHLESQKSPYYVPFDYFVYKIQDKLNDSDYSMYVDDKNIYDRLFCNLGVQRLSNVVPYQRIISWDFTIDHEGNPVFIEMNRTGGIWGAQESSGKPFFGKHSDEVKEYLSANSLFIDIGNYFLFV